MATEEAASPPTVIFRGGTSSLRKLRHTLAKTCSIEVGDDAASANASASVIVVCGDANSVSSEEAEQHLASGASLLFLLSGTSSSQQQVPAFLRKIVGIAVNEDTVVGLSHATGADTLHPKVVRIVANGAAHTDIIDAGIRSIVYPEGMTLRSAQNSTAVTIFSSGPESFPTNRPIAMAWEQPSTGGRVVVVGSSSIFSDSFLKKEGNGQMCNAIFQYLLKSTDQVTFKTMTAGSSSITIEDDQSRPDIAALANSIKPCLGRLDPLPQDLTELYCDDNLFGFDTDTVSDLYQAMDVPREPLQLIQPEFEIVMPPLRPAVFSPQIELPPPKLELFNLDEECTDRRTKLGQLTNECLNEGTSAEEFVRRAGAILGGGGDPGKEAQNGKAVLSRIFGRIVDAQIRAEDRLPVLHVDTRAF